MAGAVLLFACSYLHASGMVPGIIYAAYGVYVAAVMVAELFRKQVHPYTTGPTSRWDRSWWRCRLPC